MSEKTTKDYNATQGSVYLITSDGRTLRLPIPSESPKDPLKWSQLKRFFFLGALCFFTVVGLVLVQGTSLLLSLLGEEYPPTSIMPLRVDMMSSIPCVFWGIGALIWVPLSVAIGRRPVFLLCSILLTLATIMAGLSQGFYVHLAARCLQGLAGAISPSMMILMIIDVTYIHQRPQYIAMVWCLVESLSNVGLALTPYIVEMGGTWRAFYWVWAVPCILSIFAALFWAPETYFERPPMAFDGHILAQSGNGSCRVYSTWDEVPGGEPESKEPESSKKSSVVQDIIFWNRTQKGGWPAMKACHRQLLICALNPLIFWILILDALVIAGLVITCATEAQVLAHPPYNFTFRQIGLAKLSSAIGSLLAFPASGILTCHVMRILAVRNRGVREPEHYLPAFILPVIVSTASMALYGNAVERQWDWRLILLFVGLDNFATTSLFVANALWVTEAFPRWAGPALAIVGCGGYAVSFGLTSGSGSWMENIGFGTMYFQLGFMTFAIGVIGFPVNFYGKRLREYTYYRWGNN